MTMIGLTTIIAVPRHLKGVAQRVPPKLYSTQMSSCISLARNPFSLSASSILLSALQKLEYLIARCRGKTDFTTFIMNYLEGESACFVEGAQCAHTKEQL